MKSGKVQRNDAFTSDDVIGHVCGFLNDGKLCVLLKSVEEISHYTNYLINELFNCIY